jgi:hypothetical protein
VRIDRETGRDPEATLSDSDHSAPDYSATENTG